MVFFFIAALESDTGERYGYRFSVDSDTLPSDGRPVARHAETERLVLAAVKACLLQNRIFAANGEPDPSVWCDDVPPETEAGLERFCYVEIFGPGSAQEPADPPGLVESLVEIDTNEDAPVFDKDDDFSPEQVGGIAEAFRNAPACHDDESDDSEPLL